jgi:spore coat protein U-like protein
MRFMKRSLLVAALVAFPGAVAAQSADVTATANVIGQLTVTDVQDLDFGDVIPGQSVSVAPDAPGAGIFEISASGATTQSINLSFTLPGALTLVGGTATLPLTHGAGTAGHGPDQSTVASDFDPAAGATVALVGGQLFVFIGGTVDADAAQEAGAYEGTITLTVSYDGV